MRKRKFCFILTCALFFILFGCSADPTEEDADAKATELFKAFQTEPTKDVVDSFGGNEWKEDVSVQTLEENIGLRGETTFESFIVDEIKQTKDAQTVVDGYITSPLATSEVRLIFTQKLEVLSLEFQVPVAYIPFPNGIIEEDITVGEESDFPLGGKMTLPKDPIDEVPVVVLVHGSGAADYDESVYSYKPFRDIAWGLAEQGIASIRYDKRTFVYGNDAFSEGLKKMSVKEETIEDALRAVDVLLADERIDSDEIYVVGHSLGGMLAPRIASKHQDVAGIISLAGSPRLLPDIMFDQQEYFLNEQSLPEALHDQQQTEIDGMRKETAETLALSEKEIMSTQLLGQPAYYYWEMEQHPVEEIVSSLDIPIYILQGDKDFQVFKETDYEMWKELLSDYEQASFSSYPHLNHFFIEASGEPFPQSYEQPGVVSEEVMDDIATWIHEQ